MQQPSTSRVVVVSDIHMGPAEPHPLFQSGEALARLVRRVAADPGTADFVILGDALDYLAFAEAPCFTREEALSRTEQIVAANAVVFEALRDLAASGGKRIVWCLGNHDLELAFPAVRARLEEALGSPKPQSLQWHLSDEALDYELGGRSTLHLVHGNRVDVWNRVQVSALLAIADKGGSKDFLYPLGSRLVARVINVLKRRGYGHIDLLKPEETVALPLTLALWPEDAWSLVREALPLLARASLEDLLSPASPGPRMVAQVEPATDDVSLLRSALASPTTPADAGPRQVSLIDGLKRGVASRLHQRAAKSNAESHAFSLDVPAEADLAIIADMDAPQAAAVGGVGRVLVAGHTHLKKSIPRRSSHYFNTGTWAQLMRLSRALDGEDLGELASKLRAAVEDPASAPRELRPKPTLTYVDVAIPNDGRSYSARLVEHEAPAEIDGVP